MLQIYPLLCERNRIDPCGVTEKCDNASNLGQRKAAAPYGSPTRGGGQKAFHVTAERRADAYFNFQRCTLNQTLDGLLASSGILPRG
jgi:hypothetical protein